MTSHSELCPVCRGTGVIDTRDWRSTDTTPSNKACHGCGGSGWVTVHDYDYLHPDLRRAHD